MTIAIFRIRRPRSELQDVRVPALSMEITAAAAAGQVVEEEEEEEENYSTALSLDQLFPTLGGSGAS